jgi:hypothetical protein
MNVTFLGGYELRKKLFKVGETRGYMVLARESQHKHFSAGKS